MRAVFFFFLLFTAFVYFISASYITCSNDGSHFALVRNIVEYRTLELDETGIEYTRKTDLSFKDGKYYSDRSPGTAYLAIPFYLVGKVIRFLGMSTWISKVQQPEEIFVMFLPIICGLISIFVVFELLLFFGVSGKIALSALPLYAFGTLQWLESSHLYSHQISILFVLMAIYFIVNRKLVALSLSLAVASIVEIQNILLLPFFIFYLITKYVDDSLGDKMFSPGKMSVLAFLFLVVYSLLPLHNYFEFGVWTIKSNSYHYVFKEENSFITSLSGNYFIGLERLLMGFANYRAIYNWHLGIQNEIPGVFGVSPFLLFCVPGWFIMWRRFKYEVVLMLVVIITLLSVVALHKTVLTRHISTIYPLFFIPCVIWLHKLVQGRFMIRKAAVMLLFASTAVFSVARVYYSLHTYWGHSLKNPFPFIAEWKCFIVFLPLLVSISYLLVRKRFVVSSSSLS